MYKNIDWLAPVQYAAICAYTQRGIGDKKTIDYTAVQVMRNILNGMDIDARVILCEGKKDHSFCLDNDERLGITLNGINIQPKLDLVLDPVDGTTRLSQLQDNVTSIIMYADRDSIYVPENFYVLKAGSHYKFDYFIQYLVLYSFLYQMFLHLILLFFLL